MLIASTVGAYASVPPAVPEIDAFVGTGCDGCCGVNRSAYLGTQAAQISQGESNEDGLALRCNAYRFNGKRLRWYDYRPRNRCVFRTSRSWSYWFYRRADLGTSVKASQLSPTQMDRAIPRFAVPASAARAWIAALLTIEIFILLWAYSFSSHCIDIASLNVCLIPSKIGLRAIAFLFVFGLIVLARSNIRALLCCNDREKEVVLRWVWVQLVGFCLIMLPRAVGFRSEAAINPALIPWLVGGCLAVFGAAFALASPETVASDRS